MQTQSAVLQYAAEWFAGYISRLQSLEHCSPERPAVVVDTQASLVDAACAILLHKRNRIPPSSRTLLHAARREITAAVRDHRPIRIVAPFGCYKPDSLPSPTTVNWAEFFHLSFISRIAADVGRFYQPGVDIHYKLGDIDMPILANVSEESVESYARTFARLVDCFRAWVPTNVAFSVSTLSDCVSCASYRQMTQREIARLRPSWEAHRHSNGVTAACGRTERNNAGVSLTANEVFEIALRAEAMVTVDLLLLAEHGAINLIFRRVAKGMHTGQHGKTLFPFKSAAGSLVQFWVGEGGLAWNGRKLHDVIYGTRSVSQVVPIGTLPFTPLPGCGANFDKIVVYRDSGGRL